MAMPDYDRAVDMVDDLPSSTPTPENPALEPVPAETPTETATAVVEPPAAPPPPVVTTTDAPEPAPEPSNKHWYVVKVQSGREESIKDAIERRVKIEGLEEFFGQIVVPVEKVTEMRNGKRVVKERKLYPGYLMCEVEYNDRILYLFRETSGVGDFVGGSVNRAPPPMPAREVERMLGQQGAHVPGIQVPKPKFEKGDRVKVKDGTFAGMEGEVKDILEAKGLVRVELTIFGRPVPVELEYWQVENV
jgi:transcription termination/antitermination protein NusG